MKIKKALGMTLLVMMSIFLVSCGTKTPEEVAKTELKKEYVGYSKYSGYDNPFDEGHYILKFNKSEGTISNSNDEEKMYYEVVSEKNIPKKYLKMYKDKIENQDHFFISVSSVPEKDMGGQVYCVILTEGGNKIQIFEFETGYSADGYYNFEGKSE